MISQWLRKLPLRGAIMFASILIASVVMAFGGFFYYSSQQTKVSIGRQVSITNDYKTALELNSAVNDLRYYGAELANSLSDSSYDAFMQAAQRVDAISEKIPDPEFQQFVVDSKGKILTASLNALDAYIVDDRGRGDAIAQDVRSAANELNAKTQKYLQRYEKALEQEETAILARSQRNQQLVIAFAVLTITVCIFLGALTWGLVFSPIEEMISSLSKAAQDTANAADHVMKPAGAKEVDVAIAALNRLLVATSDAIDEARTQTRNAEQSERRWKALFNESPDAILLVEPNSTEIIDRNPATRNLLCMAESSERRLKATDFHAHEIEELKQFFSDVLKDGCARCDSLSCGIDDKFIPVSVVGVALPEESKTSLLLHIRDMSAQREHEQELRQAWLEAEKASEAKGRFLANMSHEIRTPLNGILGMAQALQNASLEMREQEMVATIVDSGKNLTSILNDILDLSKIEADRLDISPVETDLHESISSIYKLFAPAAAEKDLAFELSFDELTPKRLRMDAVRVRQCVTNIVANAIKFTKSGGVYITVGSRDRSPDGVEIEISVRDTGIGMSDDMLARLFKPFTQADGSLSRGFGGTGLGMTISRGLARAMGGDITARSREGVGSEFVFSFIACALKESATENDDADTDNSSFDLSSVKALLVDDNLVNRQVVKVFVAPNNMAVVEAENGKQALAALEKETFDIVLMDIHMPVMDGITAVDKIRNSDEPWRDVPVVALTADAMSGDAEKYLALGMDGYLSKPIDQNLLLSTIAVIVQRKRAERQAKEECMRLARMSESA